MQLSVAVSPLYGGVTRPPALGGGRSSLNLAASRLREAVIFLSLCGERLRRPQQARLERRHHRLDQPARVGEAVPGRPQLRLQVNRPVDLELDRVKAAVGTAVAAADISAR